MGRRAAARGLGNGWASIAAAVLNCARRCRRSRPAPRRRSTRRSPRRSWSQRQAPRPYPAAVAAGKRWPDGRPATALRPTLRWLRCHRHRAEGRPPVHRSRSPSASDLPAPIPPKAEGCRADWSCSPDSVRGGPVPPPEATAACTTTGAVHPPSTPQGRVSRSAQGGIAKTTGSWQSASRCDEAANP